MDTDAEKSETEYRRKKVRNTRSDLDLVYKCYSCGKNVFKSDILHGVGCKKCGSMRIRPFVENLTKLGILLYRFLDWKNERSYKKTKKT